MSEPSSSTGTTVTGSRAWCTTSVLVDPNISRVMAPAPLAPTTRRVSVRCVQQHLAGTTLRDGRPDVHGHSGVEGSDGVGGLLQVCLSGLAEFDPECSVVDDDVQAPGVAGRHRADVVPRDQVEDALAHLRLPSREQQGAQAPSGAVEPDHNALLPVGDPLRPLGCLEDVPAGGCGCVVGHGLYLSVLAIGGS